MLNTIDDVGMMILSIIYYYSCTTVQSHPATHSHHFYVLFMFVVTNE